MSGWDQVNEYMSEAEERQASYADGGNFIPACIIKSGDEAHLTFLAPDPTCLWMHFYSTSTGKWKNEPCIGEGCELCEDPKNKRRFRCFWSVVDHRERTYTNKKGEEIDDSNRVKFWECSPTQANGLRTVLTQSGKSLEDENLIVKVVKTGKGTQTQIMFFLSDRDEDVQIIPDDAAPINFEDYFEVEEAKTEATATPEWE